MTNGTIHQELNEYIEKLQTRRQQLVAYQAQHQNRHQLVDPTTIYLVAIDGLLVRLATHIVDPENIGLDPIVALSDDVTQTLGSVRVFFERQSTYTV